MGHIRESYGKITIESRRESFYVHYEGSDLSIPSPEYAYEDLPDLIGALQALKQDKMPNAAPCLCHLGSTLNCPVHA